MQVEEPINSPEKIENIPQKRIHRLTAELANQIAAGEVVERPASVLKELLENSLDAGSTQIDVTIEKGGLGLIRVQDNGHGICKEDLELALSQHATSKILCFSDLEGVASFGFRGEALASISAVSRLKLSSCVLGQTSGFCIQKEGRQGDIHISVCPPILGTTVEVRDIFYNTPARRKFLRSEKTESLYIEECFKRIALSQPAVSFTFKIDEKPLRRFVACKTVEAETRRVADLCSAHFIKTAQFMEADNNGLKVRGWLGSPTEGRAQADLQYFYVNGRSIRDKVVSFALRQAYQDYQIAGRYPAYILFFELDPEAVDVNVHPTKHEVRFREARSVTAFLIYSVKQALSSRSELSFENLEDSRKKNMPAALLNKAQVNKIQEQETFFLKSDLKANELESDLKSDLRSDDGTRPNQWIDRVLTILNDELLIAENAQGLVLVNIKAVIAAKTRAGLMEALLSSKEAVIPSRPLLMPLRFPLNNGMRKQYFDNPNPRIPYEDLGFVCSQIGPDAMLIREVPFVIKNIAEDFELFFENLILSQRQEQAIERIADYVAKHEKLDLSADKMNGFLGDLKILLESSESKASAGFYRQITLEELKSVMITFK